MLNYLYGFVIKKFNPSTSRSDVLFTRKFALSTILNGKLRCQLLQDLDFSDFVKEKDTIKVELYQIDKNKDETVSCSWQNFLNNYSKFKLVTNFVVSIKPEKTEFENSEGEMLRLSFRYRKIINKENRKKELWFSSYEECKNNNYKGEIDILISHPYVELPKDFI